MSVVLGRCDFRTIFILVICISIRVFFTKNALNSNNPYSGKNTIPNVNGSLLGVINAAATNNPTIACRLYLWKNERFNKPIFDNSHEPTAFQKRFPSQRSASGNYPYTNPKRPVPLYWHSTDKLPKSAASSGIP